MTLPTHIKALTVLLLLLPGMGLWFGYIGGLSLSLGLAMGFLGSVLLISALAVQRRQRQRASDSLNRLHQEFGLSAPAERADQRA